ncbi:hypothetical protein F8O06_02735 [Pseudoclavibacter sp. CFCC 14310]|uniref:HK97 gp10 family phage protein n=1 Tax=Pseudoclavibacter sp. CFCC 14310 TaxID=2615180 RepID=UPI0013016324|nr:hypothetical protein [Pseudoclavibacter sp. CFCC 14310]KAB1647473.1 hypothetical protein F8O06_02735 [Pseudoclavibacter sp. CFCC 14310]
MGIRFDFTPGSINTAGIEQAIATGLNRAAADVAAKAIPLTPLLDGDLRGSQQVTQASAGDLEATVSYDTVYAVRRHEETGVHFTEPGTGAKYLEKPFNASKAQSLQIIAQAVKEQLG